MTSQPAVRAAAILDALAFLDTFEPGSHARVLSLVPEASRALLDHTARTAWVPVEHDRATADAIVKVLGVSGAVQFWRGSVAQLAEKPLLNSFVSGMIRLFGDDPGRVIGILPKGWGLVYRDLCEPRCDRAESGKATLLFEKVAAEVRAAPNYFHCWHGICLGVADLTRMQGTVDFAVRTDRSAASATFAWSGIRV